MSDHSKFWLQTLLIPCVLAIVGFFVNSTLADKQRSFDKIQLAEEIIDKSFDSGNPDKALALCKLIPAITDDKDFGDSLVALINAYYFRKAQQAALSSDESTYKQIADAASAFNGNGINISDSLKKDPATKGVETARNYEQKGLIHLQGGNLEAAQQSFEKADKAYPGFHSSYEISRLIKSKLNIDGTASEKNQAQKEVMDTIRKKYSWKLSPRYFYNK